LKTANISEKAGTFFDPVHLLKVISRNLGFKTNAQNTKIETVD